jgi:spore germination cell wall hydrolase CwlJ-like protein
MRESHADGNQGSRTRSSTAGIALLLVLGAAMSQSAIAFVHPVALGLESQSDAYPDETAQLHCLALNIYHEARGESVAGKLAVGRVTINRVRSPRYPDSVCKVVWQRGQFSWTRDGRPDRPYNLKAWNEALQIAGMAFDFDPNNPVGRATHYHAVNVLPFWTSAYRRVQRIGRHIFYEPPEHT